MTAKAYKGMAMEGFIADWYAKNTAKDRKRFEGAVRAVRERVPARSRILEVAPGPGYLAIELAGLGYRVSGLDISRSFVRIASENAARAGVAIDFSHGDAAAMPFPDASFDHVVCMAAFKNFSNPVRALDETFRVLTPGGTASILDLRKDASLADIDAEVRGMKLSRVNTTLTKLVFRTFLLRNAYRREDLERMAAESRFGGGEVRVDGIGFELRLERPALQEMRQREVERSHP